MNASANATNKTSQAVTSVPSSTHRTQNHRITKFPNKQAEFQAFLRTLKTPGVKAHWQEIAVALGVSADTITDWQRLPEAIEAKQEGIRRALEGMEVAGYNDWKMHQAKLRMLNLKMNDSGTEGGNVTNNTLIVLADAVKDILNRP